MSLAYKGFFCTCGRDWCTLLWLHPIELLSACLRFCREIYQGWREGMCTGS